MKFEKTHSDHSSSARCGVLHTDHGDIRTPIFMPVGIVGSVKGVYHRDLKEVQPKPHTQTHSGRMHFPEPHRWQPAYFHSGE